MKKKWLIITMVCMVLLCIVVMVFLFTMGKKPYKNLDAAQIASAKVQLTPPDKTVEIEDISELVGYLNDVVIYNQDNSYTEYVGQGVTFTLIMTDGTQTEITAYNPFLIIDGVGYKTKYEPCQALNSYANELLNSGTANVILEEPPALGLVSDNTYVSALLGAYSWQKKDVDIRQSISPKIAETGASATLTVGTQIRLVIFWTGSNISVIPCWANPSVRTSRQSNAEPQRRKN